MHDLAVGTEVAPDLFGAERSLVPVDRHRGVVQRQMRGDGMKAVGYGLRCFGHSNLLVAAQQERDAILSLETATMGRIARRRKLGGNGRASPCQSLVSALRASRGSPVAGSHDRLTCEAVRTGNGFKASRGWPRERSGARGPRERACR